jgi:cysteine desulfurase / selenocysteine lyase
MTASTTTAAQAIRADFPFLSRVVNGAPIVYLDNAATTQKPQVVADAIHRLYSNGLSNIHRAVSFLAEEVTNEFENARTAVARFIGAHPREIVFTAGSTQAINVVANSFPVDKPLRVLTTTLEHHSNLLPWSKRSEVDFIPWTPAGGVDLNALAKQLEARPDLVAVAHASNFLGTIHPIEELVGLCRARNIRVLVDASQSIAHIPIDVRRLGCDYLVFSGHKIYGPSGTGALFVKNDILDSLQPLLVGGAMVKEVHARSFVPNDVPHRFEAGTPNIEGFVGLAAALEYLSRIGYDRIRSIEEHLTKHAKQCLAKIPGVRIFGPPAGTPSAPLVAFQLKGLDSGAVAKTLGSRANIVVRSGFHCAQPAHEELEIGPTVRASFAIYNTTAEIDLMAKTVDTLARFLH